MMGERCLEDDYLVLNVDVNSDLIHEVLGRLDGVTIARAACAAPIFHSISHSDKIWESLCNQQWPSTKEPELKNLIHELGGFQRFYTKCFPLIVSNWFDKDALHNTVTATSVNDFVSIVDIVFRGQSVGSRVVHGIPGVSDDNGWFSNSPFRIDLVNSSFEDLDQASASDIVIDNGLPAVLSIEKEMKDGNLWRQLWEGITVSWIVINKKTYEIANLSSYRPLNGRRHWPSDKHFMLRFGSILPVRNSVVSSSNHVQCNIALKCKLLSDNSAAAKKRSSLLITELSMQLEDMSGSYLNGHQSLLALAEALTCQKSIYHHRVLNSYQKLMRVQSQLKKASLSGEGKVDTICIIFGILIFFSFCYLIF